MSSKPNSALVIQVQPNTLQVCRQKLLSIDHKRIKKKIQAGSHKTSLTTKKTSNEKQKEKTKTKNSKMVITNTGKQIVYYM